MKFLQKNWLATAILVIALAVGGYFVVQNQPTPKVGESDTTSTTDENKVFGASLEINDGKTVQHYDLVPEVVGQTALEVTKNATGGKLTLDKSGLVDSISGLKADATKKEYWAFYINGKYADVGPADYVVKEGDKIEWKIETY